MRIVIVGAGGVGGLLGGLLQRAGHQVGFVVRGAQLAALRSGGLRIERARGSFHLPHVEVSDDPAALPPADAVLVCVKGWQVRELAPRLAPLLAGGGFAAPLQNGVEAAAALAAALGAERVAGGLIHVLAKIDGPGLVRQIGDHLQITLGERSGEPPGERFGVPPGERSGLRSGGESPRLAALAAALRGAGVEVALVDDIEAACWEKFLFIDPVSAVGAATRATLGVTRTLPHTRALILAAMHEVVAVARARGVRLPDAALDRAVALADRLPPEATVSMQRDLVAGRPSELEEQAGAVVRMARDAGVAAPVHELLYAVLLPQERAARGAGA
jgi:2-dehydropantoate 2-reductase